jgi:hypothetical protein
MSTIVEIPTTADVDVSGFSTIRHLAEQVNLFFATIVIVAFVVSTLIGIPVVVTWAGVIGAATSCLHALAVIVV